MSKLKQETIVNFAIVILALCAVAVTGTTIMRTRGQPQQTRRLSSIVDNWQRFASLGRSSGPGTAAVAVVQFSDYQCVYCRRLQEHLQVFRLRYPAEVRLVYHHFPLTMAHPASLDAAIAAECGGHQGTFDGVHRALYQFQDSIGTADWGFFAKQGGVANVDAFKACMKTEEARAVVSADIAAGQSLGISKTPTILVNSRLFEGLPPFDTLDAAIRRALDQVR